jgi:hypothetical protein
MKRTYIIKTNEPSGTAAFSCGTFVNHVVRKIGDDLAVKVAGTIYKGKDLRELQMELSKALFPYLIEELNFDDDPILGVIYEEMYN